MDKNTLSNYGWIVIAVLVLSVMIALATPFGGFIEQGVRATTEGLFSTSQNAMNNAFGDLGVEVKDQTFDDGYKVPNDTTTPEYDHNTPELHPNDGTTPQINAVYTTEDYEYRYCAYWNGSGWSIKGNMNGWGVRVLDKTKKEYTPILESINGKPVINMYATFSNCTMMTTAPVIPLNVVDMTSTFNGCRLLKTTPVIPANVKTLSGTFTNSGIITAPIIPNGVTSMEGTFSGCTSLNTYEGNKDGEGNFTNWVIPETVTSLKQAFQATKIVIAPRLPEGIKSISGAFSNIQTLTTVYNIPSTVTDMNSAFANCPNLSGTIIIDANPTDCNYAFMISQPTGGPQITVTGSSTMLEKFTEDIVCGHRIVVVE